MTIKKGSQVLRKKGVKLKKFTSDNLISLYIREMGEDKKI